jgi:hypothetical protein
MTTIELMRELYVPMVQSIGRFPHSHSYISTLGGEQNASILLTIGLDKKETWSNGIFENSRYIRFHIDKHPKGVELECFQFHVKNKEIKKFRTFRGTSEKMIETFEKYLKVVDSLV